MLRSIGAVRHDKRQPHTEAVITGIEQPATEARAVRRHHGRIYGSAGDVENTQPPWAGDHNFLFPVSVIIANNVEMIVGGVEQPPAETSSVREHEVDPKRGSVDPKNSNT